MEDVTSLISTLGFPIFVAVVLLYQNFSMSDKFQTTINQNTKTIELLVDALEKHNVFIGVNKDDNTTEDPKTPTGDDK